jgi:DNA-binding response OmpR family regulator
MMGGDITVKSQREKGSTFTLQLPLNISKECSESKNKKGSEDNEKTFTTNYNAKTVFAGKPKVLIVEDNFEMQKYLNSILEEYFEIEIAENGFEGLKNLKENKYDLISSDVMMPSMDGFVFRQEINKNKEWRNIPFILLTARSLKKDKLRGFKLGIDDYITKPFNAIEYIARINNLIINKKERDKWVDERIENVSHNSKNNDELISKLESLIVENISNQKFNVSDLAAKVSCSQRNLLRMTKKIIGLTPVNLILEIRLQKAYQLLKSHKYKSITEVRYEVGLDNASYFTRKFVERFGLKPGEVN